MKKWLYHGKSIEHGTWVEGVPFKINMSYYIIDKGGNLIYVEPDSIGEDTGQIDCNRKRIFENDIVEIIPLHDTGIIKWNNIRACYAIKTHFATYTFSAYYVNDLKIIGTACENKELVENIRRNGDRDWDE